AWREPDRDDGRSGPSGDRGRRRGRSGCRDPRRAGRRRRGAARLGLARDPRPGPWRRAAPFGPQLRRPDLDRRRRRDARGERRRWLKRRGGSLTERGRRDAAEEGMRWVDRAPLAAVRPRPNRREEERAMATLDRAERLRRLSPEQRERLLGLLREQAGSEARSEAIPPRGEETPAPLSFAQERLWLLAELDPENPAYTLSLGLRLAGPLDLAALSAALTGVVRRHAVLRSVIEAFGAGGPRQRILPAAPQALPLADLAALGAARREG